jgi:peptidyl-prolyl cis-trans isomerase D
VQGSGSAPEIEKVAFGLNKGQTSDSIPTSYGFEIIRVDDKVAAHSRSFDEVRTEIEPIVTAQKNAKIAEQSAHTLESQAKSGSLEKAATSNGFTVQDSGYFGRSQPLTWLPGASPKFADAVFDMKLNAAPEMVPTASTFVITQVTEIKPASTPTFEEVKERLATELKKEKAQALLGQKLKELSDKARASHNLRDAAKAVGATVKTSELIAPDGQVPDLGKVASSAPQVFDMKQGDISDAINLGEKGAVVALLEKAEPTDTEFALVKTQIKASLLERKRSEAEEIFIASLRDRMQKEGRIIIDQKKVQALSTTKE